MPRFALPASEDVPLAPRTTLEVGGPARYLARCRDAAELAGLLAAARAASLPVFVLGGGSNLLVSDAGFDGLVIQLVDDSLRFEPADGAVRVRAGAGVEWDALVARAVAEDLGGIECLSGIPGWVGAAPIQNVGAYGQEVSSTIAAVEVVALETGERRLVAGRDCGFGYRDSRFKNAWRGRYLVTGVELALRPGVRGTVRYPDLERRLGAGATLEEVRAAVLEVRRSKSMVIDPGDPNRRSAGSFFMNPILPERDAQRVRVWAERGGAKTDRPMPAFDAGPGRVKLAAAWLIEAAGFRRGDRRGRAGISTNHALALVNRGGATAAEIVALAGEIRRRVRETSGVTLWPEPVFLGFDRSVDELLG